MYKYPSTSQSTIADNCVFSLSLRYDTVLLSAEMTSSNQLKRFMVFLWVHVPKWCSLITVFSWPMEGTISSPTSFVMIVKRDLEIYLEQFRKFQASHLPLLGMLLLLPHSNPRPVNLAQVQVAVGSKKCLGDWALNDPGHQNSLVGPTWALDQGYNCCPEFCSLLWVPQWWPTCRVGHLIKMPLFLSHLNFTVEMLRMGCLGQRWSSKNRNGWAREVVWLWVWS